MMSGPRGASSDPFVVQDDMEKPITHDVPVAIRTTLQSDEKKRREAFEIGLLVGACIMALFIFLTLLRRGDSHENYKEAGGGYLRESFTYSRDFYVPQGVFNNSSFHSTHPSR